MSQLRLSAPGMADLPAWHLSVDGMSPEGPNLSHWPGNRTPVKWKADLSTGICLNFAEAPRDEQETFLAGATHVLNDHYDTDGFLSLLAVLRPEVALPRRELLLASAGTGDFQSLQLESGLAEQGFAVDRIVANLKVPEAAARVASTPGTPPGTPGPTQKDLARYTWLLENAEEVLDHPQRFAGSYEDEWARIGQQLETTTPATLHRELGLAVVHSAGPLHRFALNTLAQDCFRVLHAYRGEDGRWCYRFHDRTESWFEVVTFQPLPRRDLSTLCRELQESELQLAEGTPDPGAADAQAPAWNLDPIDQPVPELYFGIPSAQEYGQITRDLRSSRLGPDAVEEAFVRFFAS